MADSILIDGAPFFAVAHHDGRFLRTPGVAALARRDADGGYTVLHLERCAAINREMSPSHPRWSWALGQGLNTLLVHPTEGARADVDPTAVRSPPPIRWHVEARSPATAAG